MIQKIQKFGAAMLAPVLLFAFSGMIVGITVLFTNQLIFRAAWPPKERSGSNSGLS